MFQQACSRNFWQLLLNTNGRCGKQLGTRWLAFNDRRLSLSNPRLKVCAGRAFEPASQGRTACREVFLGLSFYASCDRPKQQDAFRSLGLPSRSCPRWHGQNHGIGTRCLHASQLSFILLRETGPQSTAPLPSALDAPLCFHVLRVIQVCQRKLGCFRDILPRTDSHANKLSVLKQRQ